MMAIPIPGQVAEQVRRSTVFIKANRRGQESHGTGVVLPNDRLITNAHVVGGETDVTVVGWHGKQVMASVLFADRSLDLALVHAPGLNEQALSLGDSDRVKTGMAVMAVGNPLGFLGAVSSGIIHRVGKLRATAREEDWIVADLQLAPGNSGGPLTTLQGEWIGVNTMVTGGFGLRRGLALSIPSRLVQRFLSRSANQWQLGVTLRPVERRGGPRGLLLLEVARYGAAEKASLLAGDLLTHANGVSLRDADDLQRSMDESRDSTLRVRFMRGAGMGTREVTVVLERPMLRQAA